MSQLVTSNQYFKKKQKDILKLCFFCNFSLINIFKAVNFPVKYLFSIVNTYWSNKAH